MESEACFKIGPITGVTIYKHGNILRQIFIIPPRTHIPPHAHPDVRSRITFISGDMLFFKTGKEMELKSPLDNGKTFIIGPGVIHGVYTFDEIGVFMNEQEWGVEPALGAHLNWIGAPINHEHAAML